MIFDIVVYREVPQNQLQCREMVSIPLLKILGGAGAL